MEQETITYPALIESIEPDTTERSPFILANTKEIGLNELSEMLTPVFSRDNVETISHTEAITTVLDAISTYFDGQEINSPLIRVSHEMKLRNRFGAGNPHRVYRDPRPAQEQGARSGSSAHFHLRQGASKVCRRHRQPTQDTREHRRPLGKNTHLQLSTRPHHRPSHWLHHLQPPSLHGRRHPRLHRPPHRGRECRETQRSRALNQLRRYKTN